MARLLVKNKHRKDMYYFEIGDYILHPHSYILFVPSTKPCLHFLHKQVSEWKLSRSQHPPSQILWGFEHVHLGETYHGRHA